MSLDLTFTALPYPHLPRPPIPLYSSVLIVPSPSSSSSPCSIYNIPTVYISPNSSFRQAFLPFLPSLLLLLHLIPPLTLGTPQLLTSFTLTVPTLSSCILLSAPAAVPVFHGLCSGIPNTFVGNGVPAAPTASVFYLTCTLTALSTAWLHRHPQQHHAPYVHTLTTSVTTT